MQFLFENWRGFLINEISFKDAKEVLDGKQVTKLVKNYNYLQGLDPFFEIEKAKKSFKNWLLDLVPDDLADGQKGASILWLLRLARENNDFASDLINGRTPGFADVWNHFKTFFKYKDKFLPPEYSKDIWDYETIESLSSAANEIIKAYKEFRHTQPGTPERAVDIFKGTEFFGGGWTLLKNENDVQEAYKKLGGNFQKVFEMSSQSGWIIMAVHNKAAACFHGTGTEWCTRHYEGGDFEDYYKPDDPLFIFIDAQNGDRFQLHFGKEEFKDQRDDEEISGTQLEKLHNLLIQTNASKKYKAALGNANKKIESNKLKEALWKAGFEDPENPNMEEFKKIFNNPNLDRFWRAELLHIANAKNIKVRKVVYEMFSKSGRPIDRVAAAMYFYAPRDEIKRLSKDESQNVRVALLQNRAHRKPSDEVMVDMLIDPTSTPRTIRDVMDKLEHEYRNAQRASMRDHDFNKIKKLFQDKKMPDGTTVFDFMQFPEILHKHISEYEKEGLEEASNKLFNKWRNVFNEKKEPEQCQ